MPNDLVWPGHVRHHVLPGKRVDPGRVWKRCTVSIEHLGPGVEEDLASNVRNRKLSIRHAHNGVDVLRTGAEEGSEGASKTSSAGFSVACVICASYSVDVSSIWCV